MSAITRCFFILGALMVACYIFYKIRKGKLEINHALYWIVFSFFLLFMGIFPGAVIFVSELLKFQSPANLIFCVIIGLLLIKIFLMSLRLAHLENQLRRFTQKYSMDKNKYINNNKNQS